MPKTAPPPRRLDGFEDYVAAETRLQELNLQRHDLQRQILDLRSKLATVGGLSNGPSHEAASLTTGGPKTQPYRTSALRDELKEVLRREPVVVEAVELQRRCLATCAPNTRRPFARRSRRSTALYCAKSPRWPPP